MFIGFKPDEFALPKKSQLIEYLNEEQPEELMDFAQVFLNLDRQNLAKVRLQDIGKTGLLLAIKDNQKRHSEHFVAFFVCCNLAMILGCDILNWCKILPKCSIKQVCKSKNAVLWWKKAMH